MKNYFFFFKIVRGVQFYKRNPFKQNFRKSKNFSQKVKGGSTLQKKPFKRISENIIILLELEKKVQKRPVVAGAFEIPYF